MKVIFYFFAQKNPFVKHFHILAASYNVDIIYMLPSTHADASSDVEDSVEVQSISHSNVPKQYKH